MQRRCSRFARSWAFVALLSSALWGQTAPYDVVDNLEGPWLNPHNPPARPMMLMPDTGELYALNAHDSTLRRYASANGALVDEIALPWTPVSLGYWERDVGVVVPGPAFEEGEGPNPEPFLRREILVVCRGTRSLVRVDRGTANILGMIELPNEPSDLLVVGDKAFVACSAADLVAEVNLLTEVVKTHAIPSKGPFFLAREDRDEGTFVLVPPMFSGNNSTPENHPGPRRVGKRVLDLDDPTVASVGLPDEDLFRIDAGAGTVTPILRGVGTVLFAGAVNPATGDYWQLHTEAKNKDPERQSEPLVRGDIVANRIAITTLPAPGAPLGSPHTFVDLDDVNPNVPGVQFNRRRSVGQPISLVFASDGTAYVAGLLTDNVTVLDSAGNFLRQFDLPDGSIPRQLLLTDDEQGLLVYNWGSNTVAVHRTLPGHQLLKTQDLGYDPAPALVQRGREVFFDASHSLNNNASCATCHVEVRSDLLAWNLSDLPYDDKGPLTTQTLAGLERIAPFHWRGERPGLIDFNGAFDGLLGGERLDEAPGSDFDAFQAFVFSVVAPANPHQSPDRVLDDSIQPPRMPAGALQAASAVNGQIRFDAFGVVGPETCLDCHTMPTGTNNDIFADDILGHHPARNQFMVTALHELYRKDQSLVDIVLLDEGGVPQAPEKRAHLGAGYSHGGIVHDLLDFVQEGVGNAQDQADITSFVFQADQGLAPSVHRGFFLDANTLAAVGPVLSVYLTDQFNARHCDVAVMGRSNPGGGLRDLRWFWDRKSGTFLCEDSTVGARSLADFLANAGSEANAFLGLPVGMAERFAVDYDLDALYNLDEVLAGTDPYDPDSDGDGFPDGHELANSGDPLDDTVFSNDLMDPEILNLSNPWFTTKVARLHFQTDEPTRWSVVATTNLPAPWDRVEKEGTGFAKTHSILLDELVPTSPNVTPVTYQVAVTATDPGGRSDTEVIAVTTEERIPINLDDVVVGALEWKSATLDGIWLEGRARVRIDSKHGDPPAPAAVDRAVVGRVFVDDERSLAFQGLPGRSWRMDDFVLDTTEMGFTPGFVPGPYLISLESDGQGWTELAFRVPLLTETSRVVLNIDAVLWISDPALFQQRLTALESCARNCVLDIPVNQKTRALTRWSLPDTPSANRQLSIGMEDFFADPASLPFPAEVVRAPKKR